ncbi:MAG TPA: hypothetical protein VEI07_22555 [Planctomycetaceae bacterium]|nr:hypothetical protein [Planctomycetaceae bacterium]
MREEMPLDRLEELVEDSVFHPSPCKRHRERVLRSAVRAAVQQKISRRMIAVAGAAALVLGIGFVVVRIATSSSEAPADAAMPAQAAPVETTNTPTPAAQPPQRGSMGEGLYRTSGL